MLLCLVALCSVLPLGLGQQSGDCGQIVNPPALSQQIVSSEDGFIPWHLGLERREASGGQWSYACGAVLVNATWAVTAGVCVENITADNIRIVAGDLDRTIEEGTEQRLLVQEVILHPEYDYSLPSFSNNIAMLRLTSAADLSTNATSVACLPSNQDRFVENPNCFVSGWGDVMFGGPESATLQVSRTDVVERSAFCAMRTPPGYIIDENQLCVADQVDREVSICDGDFGGPLTCLQDAVWYMAGVASHLTDPSCDPDVPQIYLDGPSYVDWIQSVMATA